MEKVSFVESIVRIIKTISSVPFFIEIFILTLLLITSISVFSILNSKKWKITSLIIYCVSLVLLPISHFSFFVETIDVIVENYIKILYFPSCYVYIFIIIFTDIDVFITLARNIKKNGSKLVNILNVVYFGIIQFLFFVSIRIILENNIDIFERSQLYSNTSLISFIQICSYLFWIRIGIIIIVKIIHFLNNYNYKKIKVDNEEPKKDVENSSDSVISYEKNIDDFKPMTIDDIKPVEKQDVNNVQQVQQEKIDSVVSFDQEEDENINTSVLPIDNKEQVVNEVQPVNNQVINQNVIEPATVSLPSINNSEQYDSKDEIIEDKPFEISILNDDGLDEENTNVVDTYNSNDKISGIPVINNETTINQDISNNNNIPAIDTNNYSSNNNEDDKTDTIDITNNNNSVSSNIGIELNIDDDNSDEKFFDDFYE